MSADGNGGAAGTFFGASRGWTVAGLVALAASVSSAGSEPLAAALAGASRPADFAADFAAASELASGRPIYGPGRTVLHAALLGTTPDVVGPSYPKSPVTPVLLLPAVPLGFRGAAIAWLALDLALLGALAPMLVAASGMGGGRFAGRRSLALFGVLLLWPPVLHNFEKGQLSVALAAALAAGWRALETGTPRRAGALVGLAAGVKVTPVGMIPYLLVRHRLAGAVAAATMLGLGLATIPIVGTLAWRQWILGAGPHATLWQTWMANTLSVGGPMARLLAGGRHQQPLVAMPGLALALGAAAAAALAAVAVFATARAGAERERRGPLFALWTTFIVLVNPLGWAHTATLLLLPAVLILRACAPPGTAVLLGAPTALARATGLALVLLSLPKETLYRLAGPVPLAPLRGTLALLPHLAGGLLLFAAAGFMCSRAPAAPIGRA